MRFGYCTGFAAGMTGTIQESLLSDIQACGYDYVEFPLMQIEALPQDGFERLRKRMASMQISCDVMCNMFPARVRLLGAEASKSQIRSYLDNAFDRMQKLGTQKIVLGSSGARNLPSEMTKQEGVKRLSALIAEVIVPYLTKYGIALVMEPIGHYEANFINTLPDGMEIVNAVAHPQVQLLADSVHVLYENESPEHLVQFAPHLRHIHLCEENRALPVDSISDGLRSILDALVRSGYDGTVSFEPMPYEPKAMQSALQTVRDVLVKG